MMKGGILLKRAIIWVILCCIMILLVSCSVPYEFAQNIGDVDRIRIDIVNLECEMDYWAGLPYNEDQVTVIATIENDDKDAFLSEFIKIKSYQPNIGGRIDSINGKAIRITYPDGEVELITSYGTATVTDGEIWNSTITFDSEDFETLMEKYS